MGRLYLLAGVVAVLAGCGVGGRDASRGRSPAGCVSPRTLARAISHGHKAQPSPLLRICPPGSSRGRPRAAAEDSPSTLVLTVPDRIPTTAVPGTPGPTPRPAPQPKQNLTFVPVVR